MKKALIIPVAIDYRINEEVKKNYNIIIAPKACLEFNCLKGTRFCALEYFYKLKEINSNYPFLRYNLICILRSKKTLDLKIKNYELVKKLLIFLFENNDVHHDSISKNAIYFINITITNSTL